MGNDRKTYEGHDRSRMAGPPRPPGLPDGYLNRGYFDEKGNIFHDLVTTKPEEIAKGLGAGGVTSTQLRRFYTKAKAVEQRVDSGESFDSVVGRILELKQHAANAVGRAQGRDEQAGLELLKKFIDRNVDLAVKGKEAFRKGFLLHFQGVVAYFKYYDLKKGGGRNVSMILRHLV
ncbi:hypothetical protein MELA_00770, partial [Candidatus Methylomirabilis lanthanidiphila]